MLLFAKKESVIHFPMSINYIIASKLPDIPRWVEVRANLLWNECEIFGLVQEPELSLVIREADTGTVFIIGQPDGKVIQKKFKEKSRR